jgi:hypothetical protein
VPVDEAIGMLAFDSEKQVVKKAKQVLESGRFSS